MAFETYKRPNTTDALPPLSTEPGSLIAGDIRGRGSLGYSSISTINPLAHRYRYVASSTRRGKGLDMNALERRKRERELAFRYRNPNSIDRSTTEWSGGSNRSFKGRLMRVPNQNPQTQNHGVNFTPTTAKQIYFVLNGRPSHIYRCLLNPARPLDLEAVLEEVSRGLETAIFKVFTYDGDRVISMDQLLELKDNRVLAVPRHERLMLHGRAYSDVEPSASTAGLPPIRRLCDSSRLPSKIPHSTRRYRAQTQGNSIERPRKPYFPPTTLPQQPGRQRYVSSLMSGKPQIDERPPLIDQTASSSGDTSKESRVANFPRIQDSDPQTTKKTQWKAKRAANRGKNHLDGAAGGKKNWTTTTITAASGGAAAIVVGNTLQSSTNTADSDSGRPRSSNDFSNGHTTAVPPDEFDEEVEEDDEEPDSDEVEGDDEMEARDRVDDVHVFEIEDDYPEQPAGVFLAEKSGRLNDNLNALREEREDRELNLVKPESSFVNDVIEGLAEEEVTTTAEIVAVTKLQARTRGFLARKRAKRLQAETTANHSNLVDEQPRPEANPIEEEAAATRIQAGVRGFLTRSRLKRHLQFPLDETATRDRLSDSNRSGKDRIEGANDDDRRSDPSRNSAVRSADSRTSKRASRPPTAKSHDREAENKLEVVDEPKSEKERDEEVAQSREVEAEIARSEEVDGVVEEGREAVETQEPTHEDEAEVEDPAQGTSNAEVAEAEVEKPAEEEGGQLRDEFTINLHDADSTFHGNESEVDELGSGIKIARVLTPKLVTNDVDADHDVCSGSDEDEEDVLAKRTRGPEKVDSYSVTVKLGNRWAADSEAELYITMIGDRKESEKFYLRHKYVNWLESEHTNYVQQSSDTFQMRVDCGFLGVIRKLIVGHDTVGYGAGVFIDRIIVTEDALHGRAFLFQCLKWFDSGQVDGKLERTLKLTAYYDMDPIPHAMERLTCGRWEVILHNGDSKGQGGTTSNLRLVGFGTRGSAVVELTNESELREVPSKTLMQCHFDGIGELLKLRVEIDGAGDQPDYLLDQVELRDLDTQDRCVLICGRWLRWASTKKGDQPFREFLTFRLGTEPLPLITYDGKLRITPPKFECIDSTVRLELVGDMGESGAIWLDLSAAVEKNGKMVGNHEYPDCQQVQFQDLSFKVEAVSIGKLNVARLYLQPNDIGEQIYEGFAVLQEVWGSSEESTRLTPLSTGTDWLVGLLYVREGSHTPYRYVLNNSRIRPRSTPDEPFVKELLRSVLEGTSTRVSRKKALEHRTPTWLLSMSLSAESRLLPLVSLCGLKDTAQMDVISSTPTDNLLSFRLKESDLGELCKVRVKTDPRALLGQQNEKNSDATTNGVKTNGTIIAPTVHIKKMRLSDSANGDEIRFPSADVEMESGIVIEFPAFWPDRPPLPNIVYEAYVSTGASNLDSNTLIWLNIFGEFGDVSYRKLEAVVTQPEGPIFSADSNCTFEFEAVSIGVLTTAEITVECEKNEFLWECTQLVVSGSLDGQTYAFQFSKPFTAQNNRQNASVSTVDDS